MGEAGQKALRVGFDRTIKLEFHGAKVVHHARYVTFQLAEVAIPRGMYGAILERIRRFAARPATAAPW